jgi:hypothetical protein
MAWEIVTQDQQRPRRMHDGMSTPLRDCVVHGRRLLAGRDFLADDHELVRAACHLFAGAYSTRGKQVTAARSRVAARGSTGASASPTGAAVNRGVSETCSGRAEGRRGRAALAPEPLT